MSVSFKKSGIATVSGTGIGENYLKNGIGANGLENWSDWGYATGRNIQNIYGINWLHHKCDGENRYGGFQQVNYGTGSSDMPIKPNTYYTISGLWFASANTNCRYWLHMRSSEGGANIVQYANAFVVGTKPEWFYYTFNSGSSASYTINRFCLMTGGCYNTTATDVYCTYLKFEEGQIATPYIPCASDSFYLSDDEGFIEKPYSNLVSAGRDYLVGETLYEY